MYVIVDAQFIFLSHELCVSRMSERLKREWHDWHSWLRVPLIVIGRRGTRRSCAAPLHPPSRCTAFPTVVDVAWHGHLRGACQLIDRERLSNVRARDSDACNACLAVCHGLRDHNMRERQLVHPLVEGRVPVGCDHQVAVDLVIHYLTNKHSA